MIHRKLIIMSAVAGTALSGAACTRTIAKLSPAPGTNVVEGAGKGAAATVADVRVVARAGAWQWQPRDLETKATPILLELRNDAKYPVSVRYNRISLTDADGHRFAVMAPYDVDGSLSEAYTVRNPFYGFDRFTVAPYLSRWYPRFSRYAGAFALDRSYYSPYATRYREIKLPTVDMVQRALPEGVLSPGGHATGFVYFEALHRDAKTLTLTVDIVDASTGELVNTAHIPFVAN
ncbi:MAG TPA: hypothetical protein VK636_12705 [Gemmatimonadaceae bacterium]|nr:hypothetical protein [Gemmatimonadaceae bacterium]